MTSERLQEILDEISDNGTRIMRPHMVMKAMKQAVNEAIKECGDTVFRINSTGGQTKETDVLNLKVK